MAPVNPQVNPTADPNYLQSSQGVYVPDNIKPRGQEENRILPEGVKIADRSAEYQGQADAYAMQAGAAADKGFADIFGAVVQGADYLTKVGTSYLHGEIDRKVYDIANAEREKEITYLNEVQAGKIKGDPSLMDANASMDVPGEVAADVTREVEKLAGLKEFNKLSRTDYLGRQMDAAKELRMQYPGFKPYIDNKFKEVLGTDIANAYMAGKISDINKASQTLNSNRNRSITLLTKSGMPGADGMLVRYLKGEVDDNQVSLAVTQYNSQLGKLDLFKKTREAMDIGTEAREKAARKEFDYGVTSSVNTALKGFRIALGADTETGVEEFIAKADNYSAQQVQAAADQIRTLRETIRARWVADSMAPGKDGRTLTMDLGGSAKRDQAMNEGLAYLTTIENNLRNKETGAAFRVQRQLEAKLDDTKAGMVRLPGIGTDMMINKSLKDYGLDPKQYTLEVMDKDVVAELRAHRDTVVQELKAQTAMKNGKPTTGNTVLDNAKENGITSASYVNNIITEAVEGIKDARVPDDVKKNLGVAMFSPENRGFISRIAPDSYDSQGRFVPGQWFTYRRLTNDEVATNMHKLGGKSWGDYRSWAQVEFKGLFGKTVEKLNEVTRSGNVEIGWDTDKQNFVVRKKIYGGATERDALSSMGQSARGSAAEVYFNRAQEVIAQVNSGLDTQKTIAKLSGNPLGIEGYMMNLLTSSNWSESAKTAGLPQYLQNAIVESRRKEEKATSLREFDANSFYGRVRDKK